MSDEPEFPTIPPEQKLDIQKYVEAQNRNWLQWLGIANLGAIIAAFGYVLYALPEQASSMVATQAADSLNPKIDELFARTERRLLLVEARTSEAEFTAGRLSGISDNVLREAGRLRNVILEAQDLLTDPSLNENTLALLRSVKDTQDTADVLTRISRLESSIESRRTVRVLISEIVERPGWEGTNGNSSITSADYQTIVGPFSINSNGGDLLVLFDVNNSAARERDQRFWLRLVVNGDPVRTVMDLDIREWEFDSIVLNELVRELPAGSHTIEFQAKSEAGSPYELGHRNLAKGDAASAKLIVLEIPG